MTKHTKKLAANFATSTASTGKGITGQAGMALLTILLIVVAITIVAGSMLARQKVMIREYELTKRQGEFKEYALAGESYAISLIEKDSKLNQVDSLKDSWAKPLKPLTINQAKVSVTLEDDAARFNINNLYHDGKVDEAALAFFKALLEINGLSPTIAMAVLDWQDPDADTSAEGGAEADFYQSTGKKTAMEIANQPFVSVDELQYVRGLDEASVATLKPYLTAVPYFLPMNVNTLKPPLLAALPLTASQLSAPKDQKPAPATSRESSPAAFAASSTPNAEISADTLAITDWANARINNPPLQALSDFWTTPIFASIDGSRRSTLEPLLDTHSRSFRVWVTVEADHKQLYLTSQIVKILPRTSSTSTPSASAQAPIQAPIHSPSATKNEPQVKAFNRQFLPYLP